MTLWSISLIVEGLLAIALTVRSRLFAAFVNYLACDLAASSILYLLVYSPHYDVVWRGLYLFMLLPLAGAVMEAYKRIASDRRYWRFSDGTAIPLAACGALLFRLAQDAPLRWPWSNLEQTFTAVATIHAFFGMLLLIVIAAQHRRPLLGTEEFGHAALFALYLMATSICYFGAARFSMSLTLLWIATAFYAARLVLLLWHGSRTAHSMRTWRFAEGEQGD